jgi:hypothetical protein
MCAQNALLDSVRGYQRNHRHDPWLWGICNVVGKIECSPRTQFKEIYIKIVQKR